MNLSLRQNKRTLYSLLITIGILLVTALVIYQNMSNMSQKIGGSPTVNTSEENSIEPCLKEYINTSTNYSPTVYKFDHKNRPVHSYTEFTSGLEFTTPFEYIWYQASSSLFLQYTSIKNKHLSTLSQYKFLESCTPLSSMTDKDKLEKIYGIITRRQSDSLNLYYMADGLADQIEESLNEKIDYYSLISNKDIYTNEQGVTFFINTYNIYTVDRRVYSAAGALYVKGAYVGFVGFVVPKTYIEGSSHSSMLEYSKKFLETFTFIKPEQYDIVPIE